MKIKDGIMAIAIIVLTIFVTFYGINTVFPKPQYEDYCDHDSPPVKRIPGDVCLNVCVELYELNDEICEFNECGSGCGADNINSFETLEECQNSLNRKGCYEELEQAQKIRSRWVFFIALPLGILIIALGAFVFGHEAVGAGLMGGGVGTLIYGSGAFWPYTENWARFLISLIGLVILIWFVYWFGRRKKK